MKRLLRRSLALLVSFASLPSLYAAEPTMSDVLRSCPKTANAIVQGDLVALRKLTLGSPIQADLPSNVTRVRIAAELNLESFHPAWEIGYAALEKMQGADYFAKREAGYIDTVNGRQVVWTPNEMYLIPLQDNVLSIVRPADRRFVGQWLKKDRSNVVSNYLQQVAARNFDSKSVLIAVDVEDVLSPQIIQERLQGVKSIAGKNLAALSSNLGDLQGVTIEVANESLQATITVDFRNPVAELAPVAKEFFGEVLAARGVQLAGYSNWQVGSANDGKSLRFTGPIATETLDDLLGMFTVHRGSKSVASNEPTPPASTPETSQSVIGENTRDYFKKIINIVHRVRDYSASNTGERAQWNGNMANRIDELPTLDVDPQMVMFGAEIAKSLRTNMMSMQLTNIATGAAGVANDAGTGGFSTATAGGTYAGYGGGAYGYYGSYGGNFVDPNSPMKYYQMGQAKGNTSFKELVARLEQSIADMRRTMTDKYKIQF